MNSFRFHRFVEFFTGIDLAMGILWLGLAAFTVGLLVLRYTRWGQSHQLEKCMVLSVLAHVLILGYVATMRIVSPQPGGDSMCFIALEEDTDSQTGRSGGNRPRDGHEQKDDSEQPWQTPPQDTQPKAPDLLPSASGLLNAADKEPAPSVKSTALDHLLPPPPQPVDANPPIGRSTPINTGDLSQFENTTRSDVPKTVDNPLGSHEVGANNFTTSAQADFLAASDRKPSPSQDNSIDGASGRGAGSLPDLYKLRVMPNRSGIARQHGATPESEKAVQIALHWLANNQADDGRWNPAEHNAGRELSVQGRNRLNAGSKADSGITGLALLAFLAGGHTHQTGPYAENVRRGLEFLLSIQAADGALGGNGQAYEFMYCHAMAACALSEAYGMTHDRRLERPVRRAIAFTIAAQDQRGGGWRYRPGDPGDTSQLGWQLMALKSADLAGIPIPPSTRAGIIRFLHSVSSGGAGRPAAR